MKVAKVLLLSALLSVGSSVQVAVADVFSHRIRGLEITTKQQQAQISQLKKEMEKIKKESGQPDLAAQFDHAGKSQKPGQRLPQAPYSYP
jgi:hypothetical protein